MSGWTSRLLNLTLALLANVACAQPAQTPPAAVTEETETAVCAAEEALLEVHVGRTTRGTFIVRLVGSEIWLEPRAFRPAEDAYVDARVSCQGDAYVRLKASLAPQLNPQLLTLTFQPAPQTLASSSILVQEQPSPAAVNTPLVLLDYAASTSGNLATGLDARAAFGVQYLNGALAASAGTSVETFEGHLKWTPSAQARLNISPTSSIQVAYNVPLIADALGTSSSMVNDSLFTGARIHLANVPNRYWPVLTLSLPFQAHLRVRVEGRLVAEYDVSAGTVALRDIPLRGQQGQIEIEIRDETGSRTVVQSYGFSSRLAPVGSYSATLIGGWLNNKNVWSAVGVYGLSPLVNLEGRGTVLEGELQAQVRAVFAPDQTKSLSFGMAYDAQQPHPVSVLGTANLLASPFLISASAAVPLGDPGLAQIGASVAYAAPQYTLRLGAAWDGRSQEISSTLQGNFRTSSQWTVSPAITVQNNAWRVAVGLRYQPNPALTVSATANPGSSETTGRLGAQYRVNTATKIDLSTDFQTASVGVRYTDKTDLIARVSTDGQLNAAVRGSVYLVEGRPLFNQNVQAGAYITLDTGLPSIRVYADGQFKGTTDALGRLVLEVKPGNAVVVSVDESSVPFDISIQAGSSTLNLPGPGSYRLDWRDNFVRSRFVEFRWSDGSPAADAKLEFEDGESTFTDRLGTGYLPVSPQVRRARLTSEDGQRKCSLIVPVAAPVVTCETDLPRGGAG